MVVLTLATLPYTEIVGVALYARFWLSRGSSALAEKTVFCGCRRPKQQFKAAVRE